MLERRILTSHWLSPGARVGSGKDYRFPLLRLMKAYAIARPYAKGKRVLDIACGDGHGLSILSQGAKLVVGVDSSTSTVIRAKRRTSSKCVHYVVARAEELPFRKGSFLLVSSFQTIEHIRREQQFLKEIRMTLCPGGVFFCSTPNKAVLLPGINPYHAREYSLKGFSSALRRNFRSVKLLGIHCVGTAAVLKNTEHTLGRKGLMFFLPRLLKYFPLPLHVFLYNAAFFLVHRYLRMTQHRRYAKLSLHDFSMRPDHVWSATDLLAVCRK